MLRSRRIVYLLIDNQDLVKTYKFKNDKYLGDPLNAIKIFNEKQVDELVLLDISATKNNIEPNYELISSIAKECTMPFGYGGGIKNPVQAKKVISSGAEKVILGDAIIDDNNLIKKTSEILGTQSVSIVINYKKNIMGKHNIFIKNGRERVTYNIEDIIQKSINNGAGELVLYNIDNDGVRRGYDFSLVDKIYSKVKIPISILGGVGKKEHLDEAINKYGIIGVGAGSFYTLVGKYKAVLINY